MIHRSAVRLLSAAGAATTAVALLSACSMLGPDKHREVSYEVGAPVHKLVIKGGTGDIRVVGGGSAVNVTEKQNYKSSAPHTTHTTADGTLTLTYDCHDCGVDYDVRVPTGTTVSVTTDTGDVSLTGVSGSATARTDTGDVSLTAMGGPVTAGSNTGDVSGIRLKAARARLSTQTGGVRATFSNAPSAVHATSQTGGVRIAVPPGAPYAVRAEAQTGKVDVRIEQDDNSPHTITAKTQTGDVTVERT
ncbi:DUF4097 family beta strand repeat-containing protein [Streptomyces palmae]|uniref:DUF4097 domain-containing protein n=1 Tax=Streptomyces palmae TaxID=1701085 RepID=A0A4Z0HE09_9ACTN|nr:DUF4097 family beta strand repeat-containing protein [Streptomyces palmae]TGB19365.1 hypothetical protein E4099_00595 [Streptomyces palmae]